MKKSELKSMIKEMMLTESVTDNVIKKLSDVIYDEWIDILNTYDLDPEDDDTGTTASDIYNRMTREYLNKLKTALRPVLK